MRDPSKLHEAFCEQQKSRIEVQSMGSVDRAIYKAYFDSVESPLLVTTVITLFLAGQAAISAIDLMVSKW